MQADISSQTAIQDILIDINYGNKLSTAVNLNVTKGTKVANTTSHVKGMEHGSESTQGISTRCLNLSHHVYHNGAGLTNSELQVAAGILAAKGSAKLCLSSSYSKTANRDWTVIGNNDCSIR